MKRKTLCLTLMAALTCAPVSAKIKLPSLISDNMVLQQDCKVKIWGYSDQKNVEVTTSWNSEILRSSTKKDGFWEVVIKTPIADHFKHSITISDGEKITISNILLGEVWVGGGQSNMEMPLNGFWNCPIDGANKAIAQARRYPEIRMFTVKKNAHTTPQTDCEGKWDVSTSENMQWWSATGYFFSRMVNEALDVPVGFINCSWGGSKAEGWMPVEDCKLFDDVDYTPLDESSNKQDYYRPYVMYYGMLKPISNYTIKGWIFYQGCSNTGLDKTYAAKMQQMVKRWRADWNLGELPFYYTEIAPYNYNGSDGLNGALLREAQFEAQSLIPNSAMVSTNDLVDDFEREQIHPCNKEDIGQRLAFAALNRTYGLKGVSCDYPYYKEMKIEEDKATIYFNNAADGLSPWDGIKGFEIAGDDKVFYPATAVLNTNDKSVTVYNENVKTPVAVRYCFRDFLVGNLKNHRGLPVIPFRTDK